MLVSLFSAKARLWLRGRQGILTHMEQAAWQMAKEQDPKPVIWFHCASLGEFEQGRPVIEQFRKDFPNWCILLTFFSPSGYEVRKEYAQADHVFYLPVDTPANVSSFLNIWKPAMAVFVKYEFWFNYLHALQQRQIPLYFVSSVFRPGQHFFKWYGGWSLRHLRSVTRIFVQDAYSARLLSDHGVLNVSQSGDTRFDRVFTLMQSPVQFPLVKEFSEGHRVIVAGSSWPADEALLESLTLDNVRFIIAPHEVHNERVRNLMQRWKGKAIRFSELKEGVPADAKALVIDTIGMLSSLYQYGDMALIGGGFGKGIHNTLEAATFGLPVLFGPNYEKFTEARELIALGGAFCVRSPEEFQNRVNYLLAYEDRLKEVSETCRQYVIGQKGATQVIMDELRLKAADY